MFELDEDLMIATGKMEKLKVKKGSEIEVNFYGTDSLWRCAILEENLGKLRSKSLSIRYLDPVLKKDYSPPSTNTTYHILIRPVPPPDPFPDVGFEEGDVIDVVHGGGWWVGSVIKVLENGRYLVYLRYKPGAIEIGRKYLRPHMDWKKNEWFRYEKQSMKQLTESDFSAGKSIEVRTEVDKLGDVWSEAIVTKEKEDGTLLAKLKTLSNIEDTEISVPYSKIRPSHQFLLRIDRRHRNFKVMDKVDALLNCRWCPGVVSQVFSGWPEEYIVVLGPNKVSTKFRYSQLRFSLQWKDGVWVRKEKVSDSKQSPHEGIITTGKEVKASHSSTASNGVDVRETGKVYVTERETWVPDTAAHLTGELGSKLATTVIKQNTPITRQPEIGTTKEFHSPVVLGIDANDAEGEKAPEEMKNSEIDIVNKKKRGQPCKFINTEPKQKMQKTGLEIIEQTPTPEKQPERDVHKEDAFTRMESQFETLKKTFVELTGMVAALQEKDGHGVDKGDAVNNITVKTGVAANGSKAATIELTNMNDGNRPLASSAQSVSRSPDPMLNSVVEKHIDIVETPPPKESTMVLPFAKKSPLWKVLESMEVFKVVPQHPHFGPLLESEKESREGDAIGKMVMYTGLLEELKNLQVDHPISSIKRIDECLLKLEKHGFNVTEPRSRIAKLLVIKERQTKTLQEFKAVEEKMTESNKKRRKTEEDIVGLQTEFQRREAVLKEAKVKLDTEIARMQSDAADLDHKRREAVLKEAKVRLYEERAQMRSHAAVLHHKVRNVNHDFQAIVTAPW